LLLWIRDPRANGFIANGTEGNAAMYLERLRGMLRMEEPAPASAFPGMAYPEAVNPKSTRPSGSGDPEGTPKGTVVLEML